MAGVTETGNTTEPLVLADTEFLEMALRGRIYRYIMAMPGEGLDEALDRLMELVTKYAESKKEPPQ